MSHIEKIGNATLYLGDCREILPTLGKFDACVTDPPYGMSKEGVTNDAPEIADLLVPDVIDQIRKQAPMILAFWSAQRFAALEKVFSSYKRIMIWHKKFAVFSPSNVGYRYEPLVWVQGDSAIQKRGDVFEHFLIAFKTQGENAAHPTQKPLSLMQEIINDFTEKDTSIVDPFMGSGSTGVAAIMQNRTFTGIEIEETYFDIACKRISEAVKSPGLF